MKVIIAALALAALLPGAHAAESDFQATTEKALAAGAPAAVVKALGKEVYRGNLIAARTLGLMYRDGGTVPRDYVQARKWLKVAAEADGTRIWHRRGLSDAQLALAMLLRDGLGGKPDAEAAVSWFEQAAAQGEANAQLALAQLHLKGPGHARNPEKAYFWSSVAARTLQEAAQKEAEQLREASRRVLTSEQVKKTGERVEAWTAKSY